MQKEKGPLASDDKVSVDQLGELFAALMPRQDGSQKDSIRRRGGNDQTKLYVEKYLRENEELHPQTRCPSTPRRRWIIAHGATEILGPEAPEELGHGASGPGERKYTEHRVPECERVAEVTAPPLGHVLGSAI